MDLLEHELERCRAEKILVLAVVGVAGTTETGAVDDLDVRVRSHNRNPATEAVV